MTQKQIENLEKNCGEMKSCQDCALCDYCKNIGKRSIRATIQMIKEMKIPRKEREVNYICEMKSTYCGTNEYVSHFTFASLKGDTIKRKFEKSGLISLKIMYRKTRTVIYEGKDYEEFLKVIKA